MEAVSAGSESSFASSASIVIGAPCARKTGEKSIADKTTPSIGPSVFILSAQPPYTIMNPTIRYAMEATAAQTSA